MIVMTGHDTDVVADTRNEKTRRAGTRRAVFVSLPADPLALALHGQTSVTAPPDRCKDDIGILRHRP